MFRFECPLEGRLYIIQLIIGKNSRYLTNFRWHARDERAGNSGEGLADEGEEELGVVGQPVR